MALRELLAEPRLRGVDLDGPERLVVHRRILAEKPLIRGVFEDFYRECRAIDVGHFGTAPGARLELGAGVGMIESLFADVLITDVVPAPHLDAVVDALAIPCATGTLRAVYGINCFHHLRSPRVFFAELLRVLRPGGGCVLIEPHHGRFASVVYPRLFASEGFDKRAGSWEQDSSSMTAANQALAHNVFVRDRAVFEREFPDLEVLLQRPLPSALRYLASGGLNFRPLLPSRASRALRWLERAAGPLQRWLALHQVIALRRRPHARPGREA